MVLLIVASFVGACFLKVTFRRKGCTIVDIYGTLLLESFILSEINRVSGHSENSCEVG